MSDNTLSVQIPTQAPASDKVRPDASSFQAQHISMFKLGFERSSEAIFFTDLEGIILYVNPAFQKIYGYSQQEAIGNTPRILKSGLLSQESYVNFWERLLNREVVSGELVNKTKDGRYIVIDASANPVLNDDGKIIGFLAIQRDITERKQAYDALRENEERFRTIFEMGPFPMVLSNKSFKFIRANAAFCRMLGYSEDELTQLTFQDITHPDYVARDTEAVLKVCSGELPVFNAEKRYLRKDGSIVWGAVTLSRICNTDGRLLYILAMIEDINERKIAEQALRENAERFRGVFQNATIGLYRTTPDGKILMANPTLIRMLGYNSFEELTERNLEEFGHSQQHPRSIFKKMMEQVGVVHGLESVWQKTDGSFVQVLESASALKDENGNIVFYEGTVEDITERKLAEEALRASEERYKLLIENANDAIFVVQDQQIIFANSKISGIIGYDEKGNYQQAIFRFYSS